MNTSCYQKFTICTNFYIVFDFIVKETIFIFSENWEFGRVVYGVRFR